MLYTVDTTIGEKTFGGCILLDTLYMKIMYYLKYNHNVAIIHVCSNYVV